MDKSGKTLTIFLVVIAVLLVSLTTIAVFFFLKEVELRKVAQDHVEQLEDLSAKLQTELKESKKQIFIYQEKNKEIEEELENRLDDLDLQTGLNEELKKQSKELKDELAQAVQLRQELEQKFDQDLNQAEGRIASLRKELDTMTSKNANLQELCEQYEEQLQQTRVAGPGADVAVGPQQMAPVAGDESGDVELEKIVVVPPTDGEGTVLDVDQENEFIIVSIGEKDGVVKESVLSIYRDETYLGDVVVTQVLPDMSAADFIKPLTSQDVRQDDRVTVKTSEK